MREKNLFLQNLDLEPGSVEQFSVSRQVPLPGALPYGLKPQVDTFHPCPQLLKHKDALLCPMRAKVLSSYMLV